MKPGSKYLVVANVLFFVATIPQIISVIANFKHLVGYDLWGSFMIMIASYFVLAYLYTIKEGVSYWLSTLTSVYWTLVSVSLILNGN